MHFKMIKGGGYSPAASIFVASVSITKNFKHSKRRDK
jgi:hypothetical protein